MLVRTDSQKLVSSRLAGMLLPEEKELEMLVHELQRHGKITAIGVYTYLQETQTLCRCLSWRDGEEIQKINIHDFEKIFGRGSSLLLWRSHTCTDVIPTVPVLWVDKHDKGLLKIRQVELKSVISKDYLTPRIFEK